MDTMYQILGIISAILLLYFIYGMIKGRPDLFSKENLNKSFYSMGILALVLIAFVGFLILILRNT
jgi:hypothetical protein